MGTGKDHAICGHSRYHRRRGRSLVGHVCAAETGANAQRETRHSTTRSALDDEEKGAEVGSEAPSSFTENGSLSFPYIAPGSYPSFALFLIFSSAQSG